MEVDPVQERTGDAAEVLLDGPRSARAAALGIAMVPARASLRCPIVGPICRSKRRIRACRIIPTRLVNRYESAGCNSASCSGNLARYWALLNPLSTTGSAAELSPAHGSVAAFWLGWREYEGDKRQRWERIAPTCFLLALHRPASACAVEHPDKRLPGFLLPRFGK